MKVFYISLYLLVYLFMAGCTISRRQVAVATKFNMVAPNVLRSSVWNFVHFNLLAPRILTWRPDFLRHLCTPDL